MRMLRSIGWPALAAVLLVLSGLAGQRALAQTATPADTSPVGIWKQIDDKTGEAKSLIEITEANGELSGKVLKVLKSSKGPNPLCDKCQGALKNQPVNGMEILHGMKPEGSGWGGGTILDPKSGKTYRCEMHVIDGGAKLKVRGYIGFSLFGRTQVWLRESTQVAPAASTTVE
jgi:uncharacterized protein (DUF2147 family)